MSRFLEQQNNNFDHQIDQILRDLEELKTAQFTGQSSGMLAKITTNSVKTTRGDVVDFEYSNGTKIRTADIPLSKTPNSNFFYQITFTHRFKSKHKSPAIAFPEFKFGFSVDGVSGSSGFELGGGSHFTRTAKIIKNGSEIGKIGSTAGYEAWFSPKYSSDENEYVWETTLSFAVSENVKLNVQCSVISNDSGELTTTAKGYYNATN